ncbi:hypothetical protein L6R49_06430 [Myxococcota bacterium]|nr:hypothetical protein [Myxococcota bacterium]
MSRLAACTLLPLLWPSLALAQDQAAPLESRAAAAEEELAAMAAPPERSAPEATPEVSAPALPDVLPKAPKPDTGLKFLGLMQTKATASNLTSTNPFLDGQVLGTLGGTNGLTVGEGRSAAVEQRLTGFFTYAPPVLSGRASLTAGFEVDYAFGDQSYVSGGNVGGAFGADAVNLQTRRLMATIKPNLGDQLRLSLVLGQQFVSDSVNDPAVSGPDELFRSGGKLMFFGSEATGVSAYARLRNGWGDVVKGRLGAYTLYERGTYEQDDVWLVMADVQVNPLFATHFGAHLWTLRDRSGGNQGIFGIGPTSSLAELQGAARLDLRPEGETIAPAVSADLYWVTFDAAFNRDLRLSPIGATAMVTANTGTLYADGADNVAVRGALANAEVRLRYAPGEGSVARLEALWSSADDADPLTYSGVITGNSYGIVGAIYASHGTLLLFSDLFSINRMASVVYDVSGGGGGVRALTGSVGYDLVPGRVTVAVGGGHARDGSGSPYGSELNLRVVTEPYLFMRVGLWGAMMTPGEAALVDQTAYAAYLGFDWLVF